ncbi:hypothetical protein SG34_004520 [Thalassomonas viridans]|uniref:Uncharacterized protein n=1 Tax=Thalassomonas viridans TaxID=137584 RepID=A0AAE9Z509_9GAMM|nr:hypothetical protein [Thalassomonas viridans]WDE06200.1 hypothetical protein SG34_004520 [Thalassomonas viridans]
MDFIYFLMFIAIVLLLSHKRLENMIFNSSPVRDSNKNLTEAEKIILAIGDSLSNSNGIDQYQQLKPQLEKAKAYYQKAQKESIRERFQYRAPDVSTEFNPRSFR